ncbi:MAG TPA: DUF72 domain-containing protein [Puia sp.]|jgi:uncharacterized protein YecE (DUF72 family)|nr:DUF72 domain-containing protein [Puia sp.]
MTENKIHIGTSGWHYDHWKGNFYPKELKDSGLFSYYGKYFSTVEINNSFYRLPSAETFVDWKKASPEKFVFSVKANRYLTHMKKLKVDKPAIQKFFTSIEKLKEKLGAILFQLPPHWKINAERLDAFISVLPGDHRYTFEFRDHTWYHQEIYDILKKHQSAFCIYELEHQVSPMEITTDLVYIRLHGPGEKYQGSYTDKNLKQWAKKIIAWKKEGKTIYVYFDNDQNGCAPLNAKKLIGYIEK